MKRSTRKKISAGLKRFHSERRTLGRRIAKGVRRYHGRVRRAFNRFVKQKADLSYRNAQAILALAKREGITQQEAFEKLFGEERVDVFEVVAFEIEAHVAANVPIEVRFFTPWFDETTKPEDEETVKDMMRRFLAAGEAWWKAGGRWSGLGRVWKNARYWRAAERFELKIFGTRLITVTWLEESEEESES